MRRREPRLGTRRLLLVIAGIAFAAIPRSPFPAGPGAAHAAALAASDSTVAPPDSASVARALSAAAPDTSAAPADSTGAPARATAVSADSSAARADTTSAGSFAAEPPETLRFVPPPGLEPPPPTTATSPPAPKEPDRPYGPMPKGVSAPGERPKERAGIWGLHPAAIIAGLIVVHVLVVRAVTR